MTELTSSANADPRRENLVNGEPHRQCATCWAIIPRSNDGELVTADCGACFHISFLMSGLATKKEDAKADKALRAETRNRPTNEERDALFEEGYRWWDITDIRNKQYWCRHHQHSLAHAKELFEYNHDSFEAYREYTPFRLVEWFDAGCPTVEHEPVRLSNGMCAAPDDSIPQVPDYYLDGYNPCANCSHYERGIDPDSLTSLAHKGKCTYGAKNKGALGLLSNEARVTYDFLSCANFHMEPRRISERSERPGQLFGFAELNPMNDSPEKLEKFYAHLPRAFLPAPITPEELEVLHETDLVTLSQSRVDDVDTLQFNKDMKIFPVMRHFAKRIKSQTAEENAHWRRFSHYSDLGLSLYAQESEGDK